MEFQKSRDNHRLAKRFSNDRSGAALVEFALIGFMLLFSILNIVELGLRHLTTLQLEHATNGVARIVRTGQTGINREQYVCDRLVLAINCRSNASITIQGAATLDGIISGGEAGVAGADDYVIITVSLTWPLSLFGNQDVLRAVTVMRNEPFDE